MITRALPWLAHLGLQRRIQLLTIASLLVIFTLFWVAGQQALKESQRQSLDNQLAIAGLVASSLDQRLNKALALLQNSAAQLGQVEPSQSVEDGTASLLRDAQLQLNAYGRRLYWLDRQGDILWTEPYDASMNSKPFSHFLDLQASLADPAPFVSNLIHSPRSSQAFILLAVPVLQPERKIQGLLVEEIGEEQLGLEGTLERMALSGSAHVEVIDHEGMVLASSVSGARFQPTHTDRFASLIDRQEPTVTECHQCHAGQVAGEVDRNDEILTFAPMSSAPWGVAVRQPTSEVMAPANYLRRQIFLGGAVALAVGLLVGWWFITRHVIGPIQALDEASAEFAAGNLDVALPNGGIDEVARLTANLEQMRVRLDATLEDHRRWNEALEEMVELRTRELASLYEQFQGKEAMVKRLLGKVLTTQEEERARLARELHDSIGQSLTAIIMTATAVENSMPESFVSGKEKLAAVRSIAAQTLHDLRGLIFDLRPEVLDDLGLGLALHSQVKKYLEPAGVKVQLRAAGLKDQLPAEVETAVFRVVQEAITNIARHAQAREANISLTKKDNRLIVRVEDDGVGFDPDDVMQRERQAWGLRGMEERITLLEGRFYIGSRPGNGTLMLAEIPLDNSLDNE